MNLDLQKRFFQMSFRFNHSTPEAFGLVTSGDNNDTYLDKTDGSVWKAKHLYDFGWGSEYGFMRLPELSFDELWELLLHSDKQENQYGAAVLIEEKYAENLLEKIEAIFSTPNIQPSDKLKTACKILKLEMVRNRSETRGKTYTEIKESFARWKNISEKVKEFS